MLAGLSALRVAELVLGLFQAKCVFYHLCWDPRNVYTLGVTNSLLFLLWLSRPPLVRPHGTVFVLLSVFTDVVGALVGLQPHTQPVRPGQGEAYLRLNVFCLCVLFCRAVDARVPVGRATLAFCGWAAAAVYLLRLGLYWTLRSTPVPGLAALPALVSALLSLNAALFALFALDAAQKARRFAEALAESR